MGDIKNHADYTMASVDFLFDQHSRVSLQEMHRSYFEPIYDAHYLAFAG